MSSVESRAAFSDYPQLFFSNPFDFADRFKVFREEAKTRGAILKIVAASAIFWAIMGFDSTLMQLELTVRAIPSFLLGWITWEQVSEIYWGQYGLNMHWSALVIYGLCFWGLSRYYSGQGIHGSRNFTFSVAYTLLSVGVFEFFWMISFAVFQGQPWLLEWRWAQVRILAQNALFVFVGCFVVAVGRIKHGSLFRFFRGKYLLVETFLPQVHVNLGRWTLFLIFCAAWGAFAWIFYPYPVQAIQVATDVGLWRSSSLFPQTLYTIDVDVLDGLAAGVQFWVRNDFLHGVNTAVKVLFTLVFYSLGRVKVVRPYP